MKDFKTEAKNTWCPGCGDFGIETAVKQVFVELINAKKIKKENIVILSGIGCHGKIVDYLNVNSFNSLHGRTLAPATGTKLANPKLTVVCFSGDGDGYGEGLSHLIFSAKRNIDLTTIIHNNRVYALTTGQFTPVSPKGFKSKSTPAGSPEDPFNPLELMLVSGATFLARSFSGDLKHLQKIINQAILHKGFSFIDVLQPCVTFYNTFDFYRQRVYDLETSKHNTSDRQTAIEKIKEWDYSDGDSKKIPIGIFYKVQKSTFEENIIKEEIPFGLPIPSFKELLNEHI